MIQLFYEIYYFTYFFFTCLGIAMIAAADRMNVRAMVIITFHFRSTPVGDTSTQFTLTLNVLAGMAGTAEAPKMSDPTWAAVTVTVAVPYDMPFTVLAVPPLPVVAFASVATDVSELAQVIDGM